MRILLVHNFYGSTAPSGENKVFEAEKAMLEKHGETVDVFTRHSDEIRLVVSGWWLVVSIRRVLNLIKGALCTIGNPFAARALAKKIRAFKPDVVHFHNQFPLISPWAVRAAHLCGVKVVMTLHNYRTVCAKGIPMRDGRVCRECFGRCGQGAVRLSVAPAVKHRCYRDCLTATVPLAANIWLYRRQWSKWVDRFVVLSAFQKRIMVECGLPEEKIVVKGNFVAANTCLPRTDLARRSGVVFVGRMGDGKGVGTLIEAWRILSEKHRGLAAGNALSLIGDGDRRPEYERMAEGLGVRFLGHMPHDEVLRHMSEAKMTVLPSECWETFGLTVVESMRVGTPVVVSDLGVLPDIVGRRCGAVVPAGDADALAGAIGDMLERRDYADVCGACVREATERYAEEANYRQLRNIYDAL